MTLETQEYRSILHTSRPLRYAFIVDLEASEISKQLTDIFQFSTRMWGGRLNTIIPLLKGEISQAWWQIFKICDPDKVIACTPISQELIHKIYKDICPGEIIFISERDSILAPRQCPVSAFEIPKYQEKIPSYGKRKKYYCIKSDEDPSGEEQKFVEVNFGCYRNNVFLTESFKNVTSKEILLTDKLDVQSFINEISLQYDEKPIFPLDICAMYASKPYNTEHDVFSSNLQIIVGNSPLDLIYFWNRHMYTQGHNGRDTIWIPPELLQNEDSSKKIGKWINANYYGGNNGAAAAYVVSFSEDNLERYTQQLKQSFPSFGIRTRKMSIDSIPPLNMYPVDTVTETANGIKDHLTSINRTIIENGSFLLSPQKPPFYYSGGFNGFFAIDLRIEHKPKQFANKTEVIQVPQRFGLSFTFFGYPPITSRINNLGHPTRVVAINDNLIKLSIPNVVNFLNEYKFDLPKDSKTVSRSLSETKFHLRDSEEGKELKRLIDLFGDLGSLGNFLEDRFLVKFAYELSNIKNMNDEVRHKLKKLNHAVTILAKIISPDAALSQNQIEECIDLLDEKLNVFFNKPNNEYSLDQIKKLFGQTKSNAVKRGKDVNFWDAYKNFNDFHLEQFNYYYNKKIFLQGFRQSCPFCSHEDWYPMSQNGELNCNACASPYQVEIFPEVKIRINDLFARALKKNGYIYVAWALYHLQRDSFKSSFFYLHSQDIIPKGKQEELTDLDLIIIKDGKLGIGEVKANPGDFLKHQTLEKLEKAVNLVLPNEVYICAPSKDRWPENVINEINKFKEKMNVLSIETIVYSFPLLVEWADSKIKG